MNITDFYPTVRALAGDRQIHGVWNYGDADLLSAVRSVFLLGRGPDGYALATPALSATTFTPDIPSTEPASFAQICYEAVIVLLTGEDGSMTIQTRAMTVRDGGERKRDLLMEMRQRLAEIGGGGFSFTVVEEFIQAASG